MLHHPSCCLPLIMGRATMWDNNVFTYKGDIMSSIMSNVAFPQDPFTLTNKVRVTSITQITKQFAQDLALDLGGPWAMDTPKTEVI